MLRALEILAGSWPIAIAVVGVTTALVVRFSLKQAMDNNREEKRDRARGNQAVVVRPTSARDDSL